MASWPSDPTWTDPATINGGNQYNAADGVTADDINIMIKDLIYAHLHGGIIPSGTLRISADGTYDVTNYAIAIVDVSGSEVRPLTVDPTTVQQIINAPTGVAGYNPVTVNGVTASIDSNIQAGNIKKDVTILGVTGTYEGGQQYDTWQPGSY